MEGLPLSPGDIRIACRIPTTFETSSRPAVTELRRREPLSNIGCQSGSVYLPIVAVRNEHAVDYNHLVSAGLGCCYSPRTQGCRLSTSLALAILGRDIILVHAKVGLHVLPAPRMVLNCVTICIVLQLS